MELIKKLKGHYLFGMSIWIRDKGYILFEDYYKLKSDIQIGGELCNIWVLNVATGYAIVQQANVPYTILILDLGGVKAATSDIIYFLETGDQPDEQDHRIEIVQPRNLGDKYANARR